MMKRASKTALTYGSVIGGVHFLAIAALGAKVVRDQHAGPSQELWTYAAMFDLPVTLVLFIFSPMLEAATVGIDTWPDVAFLPGITGSWNRFLLPFLLYGVFGTAVWFVLGWLFRRVGSRA